MIKVLLLEPDKALARIYRQALLENGYSVVQVGDAQAAIHAADQTTPDVVILEPQIGTHDGVEFLYEFRSYIEWQNIPVIINSYIYPKVFQQTQRTLQRDLGVVECLYKPHTTLQGLITAVSKAVETV
jgi:DNA-binding response OmpR family regulator